MSGYGAVRPMPASQSRAAIAYGFRCAARLNGLLLWTVRQGPKESGALTPSLHHFGSHADNAGGIDIARSWLPCADGPDEHYSRTVC